MLFPNRRAFLAFLSATLANSSFFRHLNLLREQPETPLKEDEPLMLWYTSPAKQWVDALPIGNGSLGAMVFGGGEDASPEKELLQLNDDTLWSGFPKDRNNRDAPNHLAEVRHAVLDKKDYQLADQLVMKMQGQHAEAYQPLGNLRLSFEHDGQVSEYRRKLDLNQACTTTSYAVGETHFTREAFVSNPDHVLVLRVSANLPRQISCSISLDAALQIGMTSADNDQLLLTGKAASHVAGAGHPNNEIPIRYSDIPGEGMYFAAALQLLREDGTVAVSNGVLTVHGASSITLLIASATGFRGFDRMPNTSLTEVATQAKQKLIAPRLKSFALLRERQRVDHQRLFRRVSLDLGKSDLSTPTDRRLSNFTASPDPSLAALYFQYGRYLLISSSRTGGQPANLQGLWNEKLLPPWGSNWTSNINVEMNYWPAETCNLSECASPLFDFIDDLSQTGTTTARESYGLPGWAAHHNIDLWRTSNPVGEGVGSPKWANWGMAGPWLCSHLYEHFRFTGDEDFLRAKAWPLMRGCADFCLAWLIEDNQGRLTTCPSESTENDFFAPNGKPAMTSAGCTMDMALIRELFTNCIATIDTLRLSEPMAAKMEAAIPRLIPYQVGKYGQLQEWSIDFEEKTPGQRHMSHMYPLYPGNQITPRDTPDLAKAARISLERRLANGGAYTGWSRAWAICFWARLLDGDKAWESISMLLKHSTNQSLLDTHPAGDSFIFQIDGNFGATAAIAEMLLQSHTGTLDLLPALPSAWPAGKVSGLRGRGGVTVSLEWSGGSLVACSLRADHGGQFRVRAPAGQGISNIKRGTEIAPATHNNDGSTSITLSPRIYYQLNFKAI